MKQKAAIDVITMGCSKNLVDSERLLRIFERTGRRVHHNPEKLTRGAVVIVNTCGFIGDAKEESINTILECCQAKAEGRVSRVYVMGCLSQRYAESLPAEIPEVDGWYGKFDWNAIAEDLLKNDAETACEPSWQRKLTTPKHHAYLKIAEGCNRFCAFCAIPLITGRYQSRPIEEIVDEVRDLVGKGVKEFNVIAQDLTYYGLDIYGRQRIADLVEAIAQVDGVHWIRLHYAYPTDFPYDLLDVMARYDNVCKYLDIALQHSSDRVLDNMHRHIDGAATRSLLDRIRRTVPGIHLRTTLMVGFPGEGEKEFEELKQFVEEQKFERMGAFAYCEEEDTFAAKNYADDIPDEVKQRRLDEIMQMQQEISLAHNQSKIGQILEVVIDSEDDEFYVGRTQYDSPEVDPEVLITKTLPLTIGEYYQVEITDCTPFDLMGKVAETKQ